MPISIKQRGVQNHMEARGLSYKLFERRMQLHEPYTVIARALADKAGKPVSRHLVENCAKVWKEEQPDKA